MSRWHKILIGIFCCGILLCGLGVGIAFMEFSALTYGGKQVIGKSDIKTENIDVAFEPGDEEYIVRGQWNWSQMEIQTDSRVPVNHVRFQVTYNAEQVSPYVRLAEEEREFIFMSRWVSGGEDDVELMMEAKDLVLQNLKEGKIISFDREDIKDVMVLINPENEEDVKLIY